MDCETPPEVRLPGYAAVDFTHEFKEMQSRHAGEVLRAAMRVAGDWKSYTDDLDSRHAADAKAYEDLLAEAQERIDQKDKALAAAKESLAHATNQAEQYAEEADDLEEQLADAQRIARWRWPWLEILGFAMIAVGLAGLLGLFK